MRQLPPGYNPGRPRPRPRPIKPGPSVDPSGPRPFQPNPYIFDPAGPRPINFPPELINPVRPGVQPLPAAPIPRDYGYGNQLPPGVVFPKPIQQPIKNLSNMGPINVSPFNSTPVEARGGMRPDMQINSAPLQQQAFSYGGRAGYQMGGIMGSEAGQDVFSRLENLNQNLDQVEQTLGTPYDNQSYGSPIFDALTGRSGYQEGGIGMMQDQTMYNPLQSNYYSGMPMMMAGGGIANLVNREKYGLGSSLKKFVRKIIPNEISKVASFAAPFVAPFNPALAAAMAGFGSFDQTGRIGSSLLSAGLTYGGGQLARGIGGAGFQGNPLTGVDFSGGFTSGIGSLFSSPMGNLPFGSFSTPITPTQNLLDLTGAGTDYTDALMKQFPTTTATGSTYGELIKKAGSLENVPLSERFNAVKDLSTKALKDIYTTPVINPKTGETTYKLDKNAFFATLSGASSFIEALGLAKKAGLEGEYSEADYQRTKIDPLKKKYETVLKPESFGIRPQSANGGLMDGVLSIKLTPAQAMAKGGSMGSEIPVRQNQGGVTELDLRNKGGFIPVGIKEKADDVPAMLSRNEFVFTADAVRGAGGGSINKGAQKMYKLMKSLEKKVKKMKKVA